MNVKPFALIALAAGLALMSSASDALIQGPEFGIENPASDQQTALNVELLGQVIGGEVAGVAIQGSYAYIGAGYALLVLDVSDPAHPIVAGHTPPLASAQAIQVVGNYVYVAATGPDLYIVDVSTPALPSVMGAIDMLGSGTGLAVAGEYAYVTNLTGGLRIVDVSDSTHPTEIGVCLTAGLANDVALVGSYAYVADDWALRIIHVADPSAPLEVGSYALGADSIAAAGGYAYVADDASGYVRILDVSNPLTPSEVGSYDMGAWGCGRDVAVMGNYGFVANSATGLHILDVSNPSAPSEVSSLSVPGSAAAVAVTGEHAYVAARYGGLRIVDISNITAPLESGAYDPAWKYIQKVALDGDYVYTIDGLDYPAFDQHALHVVDVSDPATPRVSGSLALPNFAENLVVASAYAYIADGSSLRIIDLANPAAPLQAGYFFSPEGGAWDVAVVGNYAYLSEGKNSDGFRVLDISKPLTPTQLAFLAVGGGNIAVEGEYAYVAGFGLHVIDISNPADPIEVGFYNSLPWPATDIVVAGDYAYVTQEYDTLHIFDISNPASPAWLSAYNMPDNPAGVAVAGQYAYIANDNNGLRILDISNPLSPVEVGFYITPGDARHVAVAGQHMYVADGDGGLVVLRFTGSSLAHLTISGPVQGVQQVEATFTASIQPVTAATPITYTWQVAELGVGMPVSRVTHTAGLTDTAVFSRGISGAQLVSVTAVNSFGRITAQHMITIAESTTIKPGSGGRLACLSTPWLTATIQVPPGAVTETTYLTCRPSGSSVAPAGLARVGDPFDLNAYRHDSLLDNWTFARPVTVSLDYDDDSVAHVDEEGSLSLNGQDKVSQRWKDAACGPYIRQPGENGLAVPICRTGHFAFFGKVRIVKSASPAGVVNGDWLTYTLIISDTPGTQFHLYDLLVDGLNWGRFIKHPPAITYSGHTITGILSIAPGQPVTVAYAVQVNVSQAAGAYANLANRACLYQLGQSVGLCRWSNSVTTPVLLPLFWQTERVSEGKQFSIIEDRSLRLDSAGHPHIAYGGDALYYAWFDGAAWRLETVDSCVGVGGYASLALDGSDHPHISYYDKLQGDLRYARWTGRAWMIQVVDSAGDVGQYTSLALDGDGYPHISYIGANAVKYARWTGRDWNIQTVGWGERYTTLALGASAYPHISYATQGGLKQCDSYVYYAHWTGSQWVSEIVDGVTSSACAGYRPSLALDSSDKPSIAYNDDVQHALKYARWTENGWTIYAVDDVGTGLGVSLAFDTNDSPHIGYAEWRASDGAISNTLKYARWVDTAWSTQTAGSMGHIVGEPAGVSLALDAASGPHVGYLDGIDLKWAHWDTSEWKTQRVDQNSDVGLYASLALDASGNPHISHYDASRDNLDYVRWTGDTWVTQTVEGNAGKASSLALDADGHPHVSYLSSHFASIYTATLMYAHWGGAGWLTQAVGIASKLAPASALELDGKGYPHIAYLAPLGLSYAYWNGSEWSSKVMTGSLATLDMVLDANDRPHFSCAVWENDVYILKYVRWDGEKWIIQNVDGGRQPYSYVYHSSIALDSHGYPHLAYMSESGPWLISVKYAHWDGDKWNIQTVDNLDMVYGLSIALDAYDRPHITYIKGFSLYYARWTGKAWRTQSVGIAYTVGWHDAILCSALALDGNGLPHIAYYSNSGLYYAFSQRNVGALFLPLMLH